jgi:hypothetical protein
MQYEAQLAAVQQQGSGGGIGEGVVGRANVAAPIVQQPYIQDVAARAPINAQIADTATVVAQRGQQAFHSPPWLRLPDGVDMGSRQS